VVRRSQARGNIRRSEIYEVVSQRWRTGQYAPTIRDIAAEAHCSIATAHRHVAILIEQGRLQGKGRSLRPGMLT
jgi:DNA-binding transcriptional regulator YhcF (GntR family)